MELGMGGRLAGAKGHNQHLDRASAATFHYTGIVLLGLLHSATPKVNGNRVFHFSFIG
jgi:hypothetical protein